MLTRYSAILVVLILNTILSVTEAVSAFHLQLHYLVLMLLPQDSFGGSLSPIIYSYAPNHSGVRMTRWSVPYRIGFK